MPEISDPTLSIATAREEKALEELRAIQMNMRSNAELSGPRPLAAEGSRSNDVLGNGGSDGQ